MPATVVQLRSLYEGSVGFLVHKGIGYALPDYQWQVPMGLRASHLIELLDQLQ